MKRIRYLTQWRLLMLAYTNSNQSSTEEITLQRPDRDIRQSCSTSIACWLLVEPTRISFSHLHLFMRTTRFGVMILRLELGIKWRSKIKEVQRVVTILFLGISWTTQHSSLTSRILAVFGTTKTCPSPVIQWWSASSIAADAFGRISIFFLVIHSSTVLVQACIPSMTWSAIV